MRQHITKLLLLLSIIFISGCSHVDDATILSAREAVSKGAVIIDVRTPKEFAQGHVHGAINIPIETIVKTVADVPKNKTVVVYCASGNRSGAAAKILREKGWTVLDVATQRDYERKITPKHRE